MENKVHQCERVKKPCWVRKTLHCILLYSLSAAHVCIQRKTRRRNVNRCLCTQASRWIITGRPVKCRTYDWQDDGGTEGFNFSSAASLHFLWQDEEDVYLSQGGQNKDPDLLNRWRGVESAGNSSAFSSSPLHRCAQVVSLLGLVNLFLGESRAGRRKIDGRRHRPASPPLISSFLAKTQQLQMEPAVAGCLPRC